VAQGVLKREDTPALAIAQEFERASRLMETFDPLRTLADGRSELRYMADDRRGRMSIWEYVSVFVSIIVGLAVADLLISFHRLLRVDAQVRWYWLVPFLSLYLLFVIVNFWWGTFHWLAHISSLSMVEFLPTLFAAVAIFLLTAAVLPDEVPNDGLDLRSWYLRNASHIWVLGSISLSLVILGQAKGPFDSFHAAWEFLKSEWDNWLLLAGFVWLIFAKRLRVHEIVLVLAFIDMAYTASWLRIG
jgi:hypothetical protein